MTVFGSSPRAWSRLHLSRASDAPFRFISTCVEQTRAIASSGSRQTVHLHVRGADDAAGSGAAAQRLDRILVLPLDCVRGRFISTCVEQTRPSAQTRHRPAVHLHVRGADLMRIANEIMAPGSSPRAWSRPRLYPPMPRRGRFISTCVEQTFAIISWMRVATVHLHVRGADTRPPEWPRGITGSSPRAWSRRGYWRRLRYVRRFISTCVEQTPSRLVRTRGEAVHLHVRGADLHIFLPTTG